jgi:hypothetical protein
MDIYVDVDNTICHTSGTDYPNAKPITENIERFNKLFDEGNRIVYWTARGMKSGINWRELTEKQFKEWGVKYHELRLDKPSFDVFIDDRVINSRDWEKGKWTDWLK